ncbi:hypothetical protein J5N97_006000 [Dioscorea zingiberensis]|uniref:Uncharacterized protein n=1 Tax=Dioscorea zingiberensis TaxID=325984 RepID=A0A9D5DA45_9LILI|nr:hypothetical protein J5N97_006000 [Dioscorea zingiberensis]
MGLSNPMGARVFCLPWQRPSGFLVAALSGSVLAKHVDEGEASDVVAHIKFTVLLMPNGSDRITSHPLQPVQPTKTVDDDPEIKAWLALGTKTKKKGGGKKKKGKKGDAKDDTEAEPMDTASNGGASQQD